MKSLSKEEWDKESLTKKGKFILEEIEIHITHFFHLFKNFFNKCIESLIILFNEERPSS